MINVMRHHFKMKICREIKTLLNAIKSLAEKSRSNDDNDLN